MKPGETRFFFVSGGVVSSLCKGIAAASIGRLLVSRGFRVQLQKFDPYINVDPGTMSPFQHGEVFVTEDGAETDLDLGHYERFTDENTSRASTVTAGAVCNSVSRRARGLDRDIRRKIALFGSVPEEAVISARDVDNIYKVPLVLRAEGVDDLVLDHFAVEGPAPELGPWEELVRSADASERTVRIALVGKYVQLEDAYKSVVEALNHGGYHHGVNVEVEFVNSEDLDPEQLAAADGIFVPGGFGERGIEGKIQASRTAREQGIPYLGVCLGMQTAVVDFARHVAGMDGANSAEFDPETPFPVIDLLPEQKEVTDMGGTMRLGADPVKLHDGTRAREIFGESVIYKR